MPRPRRWWVLGVVAAVAGAWRAWDAADDAARFDESAVGVGDDVARVLLRDSEHWDRATPDERRSVAAWVERRLDAEKAGFRLVGVQPFGVEGHGREVAVFRHAATGLEFSLIPGGTFTMGSPESEADRADDEVRHEVTLTRPFLLARTEVTQAVYERIAGSNPSVFKGAERPVELVTWGAAQEFCARLGLALPTEAQWEWACRAGTRTAWSTGSEARSLQGFANLADAHAKTHAGEIPSDYDTTRWAWTEDVDDGFATTAPVATYVANAFGLFDMHGNVGEWCADWYGPFRSSAVADPTGPEAGLDRVLRGGCWYDRAGNLRSARRGRTGPLAQGDDLGFRPARSVP